MLVYLRLATYLPCEAPGCGNSGKIPAASVSPESEALGFWWNLAPGRQLFVLVLDVALGTKFSLP